MESADSEIFNLHSQIFTLEILGRGGGGRFVNRPYGIWRYIFGGRPYGLGWQMFSECGGRISYAREGKLQIAKGHDLPAKDTLNGVHFCKNFG